MINEAPNALHSGPGAGPSPEAGEPPDGGERAVPVLLIIAAAFLMLVIFGFAHTDDLAYIRQVTGDDALARAGELSGIVVAWFFLAVIIGWVASRKVKPPRRIKLFAIVFAAIGILTSLGSLATSHPRQRPYPSREFIDSVNKTGIDFFNEAGTPANGASTLVMGTDVSALAPDFSSQIMGLRKRHDQDSEQYARALGKLYSAESFSSPARMHQSMQAVDGIQKIDQDFADAFGKSLDELKTRVQASSLSARDKAGFMQGVNDSVASRKDLQKAEAKWAKATHAFYEFALKQSSAIKVENGHVLITGEAVRQEFNSRLHECADLGSRAAAAARR